MIISGAPPVDRLIVIPDAPIPEPKTGYCHKGCAGGLVVGTNPGVGVGVGVGVAVPLGNGVGVGVLNGGVGVAVAVGAAVAVAVGVTVGVAVAVGLGVTVGVGVTGGIVGVSVGSKVGDVGEAGIFCLGAGWALAVQMSIAPVAAIAAASFNTAAGDLGMDRQRERRRREAGATMGIIEESMIAHSSRVCTVKMLSATASH